MSQGPALVRLEHQPPEPGTTTHLLCLVMAAPPDNRFSDRFMADAHAALDAAEALLAGPQRLKDAALLSVAGPGCGKVWSNGLDLAAARGEGEPYFRRWQALMARMLIMPCPTIAGGLSCLCVFCGGGGGLIVGDRQRHPRLLPDSSPGAQSSPATPLPEASCGRWRTTIA